MSWGVSKLSCRTASYQQMHEGLVAAEEWDSWKVMMALSSLRRHLADQLKIYQQVVGAEELIEAQADVTYSYRVDPRLEGKFLCPVLGCAGKLGGGWMLWRHFQDLHPLNRMRISMEGYIPWCKCCSMKVDPRYP